MSESGSRTTAEMEADLRRLDPGSQRFKVLSCARFQSFLVEAR